MVLNTENTLLRIFVDSLRRHQHEPVYEAVIALARRRGLAGGTALAAIEGFGQNGELHKRQNWRLAEEREIVIEFVDTRANLDAFLAEAAPMLSGCIATLERARLVGKRAVEKA